MDTKPREIQAESYVTSKLLQNDFLVTKPTFDKKGADLLIIKEITKKLTTFVKVQSKGRKVLNPTNVKIPINYIDDFFVCFVYLIDSKNEEHLYLFTKNEIEKWEMKGKNYILYIPKDFATKEKFLPYKFSNESKLKIDNILLSQAVNNLISVVPTLVIDGVFLRNAILNVKRDYRHEFKVDEEIDIYDLIFQLCRYSHINYEKPFNCYLIESVDLDLNGLIKFSTPKSLDDDPEMINQVFSLCNLYISKTNDFVWWKIEELLGKIINSDEISLVADDPAYSPLIDELHKKEYQIKLIGDPTKRMTIIDGRYKYSKVEHPILEALGNQIF